MKCLIFGYDLPHEIEGTQQKKLKLTLSFLSHLKNNSGCQIYPQIFSIYQQILVLLFWIGLIKSLQQPPKHNFSHELVSLGSLLTPFNVWNHFLNNTKCIEVSFSVFLLLITSSRLRLVTNLQIIGLSPSLRNWPVRWAISMTEIPTSKCSLSFRVWIALRVVWCGVSLGFVSSVPSIRTLFLRKYCSMSFWRLFIFCSMSSCCLNKSNRFWLFLSQSFIHWL